VAGGRVRCGACYGVFDGRSAVVLAGRPPDLAATPGTDQIDAVTPDAPCGRDQSTAADPAAVADHTAIAGAAALASDVDAWKGDPEPRKPDGSGTRTRAIEGLPGHALVGDDPVGDDTVREDTVRQAVVQQARLVDVDPRAVGAVHAPAGNAGAGHPGNVAAGQSTAGGELAADGNADAADRVARRGAAVSAADAEGATVAGLYDGQRRRSVLAGVTDDFAPLTASEREQLSRIGIAPPEVTSPPPQRRGRTLAIVALGAALLVLVVYLRGPQWAQDPTLRPHVERLCATVGCRLPPYRDASALRARSIVLRDDPQRDNVWLIDAILANDAPFAQAFPRLLLEFTARGGVVVARRTFTPQEYLGGEMTGAEMMPPVRPVQVRLAVVRPAEAVSYRLQLLP